jgi:pyruvate dehydrogenase E1 component beta subunit
MERDESVVVMGQDIGAFEGAFRTTRGLHARWPHRVLDTPTPRAAPSVSPSAPPRWATCP